MVSHGSPQGTHAKLAPIAAPGAVNYHTGMNADVPPVAVILLNYNGWQDTVRCVAALREMDYPRWSLILIDNHSSDGSVARLREELPGTPVIETGANLGFAGGNNLGIARALADGADYVWLLNNDTRVAPDALTALVRAAAEQPTAGAVGSVIYDLESPGMVQAWGGGKLTLWTGHCRHVDQPDPELSYLTGASLLLRRAEVIRRWWW